MKMFRIGIKRKETDKRKNATVSRAIVVAETLEEAKVLAVAEAVDKAGAQYRHLQIEDIAEVWGSELTTLVYVSDFYSEKDRSEKPETVPSLDDVRAAQAVLKAYVDAHGEQE